MQNNLFTRNEAAQYLGVTPQTLAWPSVQRKALTVIKVGRCVKYLRSDLEISVAVNLGGAQ